MGGSDIFRTCPDRPWGPSSLLYNGYRAFPGGKERPGRDADPSHPSSAVVMKRVELYLHSPYGPCGLYRASVPVQGRTLPYLFYTHTHTHTHTHIYIYIYIYIYISHESTHLNQNLQPTSRRYSNNNQRLTHSFPVIPLYS